MNVIQKIMQDELNKFKKEKDLKKIPLKSQVSVQYQTQNGDKRIFRGVVISKKNNGINSFLEVHKSDADEGKRLTYKFLYYSPNLVSVTIDKLCQKKPRRAKLFYMKKLYGKKSRI